MKHRRTTILQLAVLILLGAALAASILLPQLADRRKKPELAQITVILREQDSTLWSNARLGMEQAASEQNAELRFLTLSQTNDREEQEELLRREAENGADALVIVPAGSEALSEQLTAQPLRCPYVSMESPLAGAQACIAPDSEQLGSALAEAVLADGSGPVLLLQTSYTAAITQRLEAARTTLEQAGVPVSVRSCTVSQLAGNLSALLADAGAVQLMVFEPSATIAAADAAGRLPAAPRIYGVGFHDEIAAGLEAGTIAAVAAWSDYAAGYLAVRSAAACCRSGQSEPDALEFSVLRREDMYEPENQKLLFPVTS